MITIVGGSTNPSLTAAQLALQMRLQRITAGVAETPVGPAVTPVVYRNSSFGTYPSSPLALPALNPGAVLSTFMLGD